MLGYQIYVTRKNSQQSDDATKSLASWQTGPGGLLWLRKLVAQEKAINIGGNGYPDLYSITKKDFDQLFENQEPSQKIFVDIGDDYVIENHKLWGVKIDLDILNLISPDELLIVEVWDES